MKLNHTQSQPIGIFDSGIGGLTAAHAIVELLPKENIIYFGDTAHLPYGEKSAAAIQAYSVKIAHLLLQKQCKLILIACNSASVAAFDLVKEYTSSQAIVMNVIDPVVNLLKNKYSQKRVGIIGTRQTVNSGVFRKKIEALDCGIKVTSYATNLLASAIEEFGNHRVIDALLEVYLAHPDLQDIDALVLACTHYPIIKDKIAAQYQKQIDIIDASDIVAHAVKDKLEEYKLLNPDGGNAKHFYISDYTDTFASHARLFFGEDITLERYPLWD